METLRQDLRYAFRTLIKNRGLTTVAVLSLALGIGANATIFTFINGLPFGYDESRGRAFYAQLLERVRALPGVRSASLTDHLPLGQTMRMQGIEIDGYQGPRGPSGMPGLPIDMALVGPDYFDAMGISILSGRSFKSTDDVNAPPVVMQALRSE